MDGLLVYYQKWLILDDWRDPHFKKPQFLSGCCWITTDHYHPFSAMINHFPPLTATMNNGQLCLCNVHHIHRHMVYIILVPSLAVLNMAELRQDATRCHQVTDSVAKLCQAAPTTPGWSLVPACSRPMSWEHQTKVGGFKYFFLFPNVLPYDWFVDLRIFFSLGNQPET